MDKWFLVSSKHTNFLRYLPNLNYNIIQSVLVAAVDNFCGLSTNSKRNISSTIASVFKQCLI